MLVDSWGGCPISGYVKDAGLGVQGRGPLPPPCIAVRAFPSAVRPAEPRPALPGLCFPICTVRFFLICCERQGSAGPGVGGVCTPVSVTVLQPAVCPTCPPSGSYGWASVLVVVVFPAPHTNADRQWAL